MKKLLFAVVLALPFLAVGHEGHDHDAPVVAQAPKAGILKKLDEAYVEVVSKKNDLKIYFYDLELKPITTENKVVEATVKRPRQKQTEKLNLTDAKTHLETTYDAKGLHRYTLKLQINDTQLKRDYKLNYNIEPKK